MIVAWPHPHAPHARAWIQLRYRRSVRPAFAALLRAGSLAQPKGKRFFVPGFAGEVDHPHDEAPPVEIEKLATQREFPDLNLGSFTIGRKQFGQMLEREHAARLF